MPACLDFQDLERFPLLDTVSCAQKMAAWIVEHGWIEWVEPELADVFIGYPTGWLRHTLDVGGDDAEFQTQHLRTQETGIGWRVALDDVATCSAQVCLHHIGLRDARMSKKLCKIAGVKPFRSEYRGCECVWAPDAFRLLAAEGLLRCGASPSLIAYALSEDGKKRTALIKVIKHGLGRGLRSKSREDRPGSG